MSEEIRCLQIILIGTRKDADMFQGTSLGAENCEEKVKDNKQCSTMESFHRQILQESKKNFMTQTGEPNSIHESPALIYEVKQVKDEGYFNMNSNEVGAKTKQSNQNETKQKSQQIFFLL